MKQWRRVGIPLTMAVLVAAIIFQFGTGSDIFHHLAAWTAGLFGALFVYVVFGLIERRFTGADQETPGESPASLIRTLFRRSPGIVQLFRLGLTVYVGALAHALADNAMFSPFAVKNISVVAGIVVASLAGLFLHSRGPIRRTRMALSGK